jgi:hypothetical protein
MILKVLVREVRVAVEFRLGRAVENRKESGQEEEEAKEKKWKERREAVECSLGSSGACKHLRGILGDS